MQAIVLLAHGARDPEWATPILAIRDYLRNCSEATVETAFLEFIAPSLPEVIDQLAAMGCRELLVLPLFMAPSGHIKRDLPKLLSATRIRHPELLLRIAAPIGVAPEVVAAISEFALRALHEPS
jgi:sirohydrochlorin cobaltochelatase